MPKYRIELSALTRVCYSTVIEAVSQQAAEAALDYVYDIVDGGEYDSDNQYWEKGTHYVYGEVEPSDTEPPRFVVKDGEVWSNKSPKEQ